MCVIACAYSAASDHLQSGKVYLAQGKLVHAFQVRLIAHRDAFATVHAFFYL